MLPKKRMPNHPGKVLFEDFLKPYSITSKEFANRLGEGWKEDRVEALIKGEEHLSEKDAEKIAALTDTSPQLWIQLQRIFDESKVHSHAKRKPE